VHPEQRERLKRYITEKRLMVGPWYILPDEFLVSGESYVRNLLLGGRMAREFGYCMPVGYIPDTFGHIAQLPQILRGFGLDTAMHFRGMDPGDLKSELWWEAPDGSRVLLHHMSNIAGYTDSAVLAADGMKRPTICAVALFKRSALDACAARHAGRRSP
jgi:alpha-mannosidase